MKYRMLRSITYKFTAHAMIPTSFFIKLVHLKCCQANNSLLPQTDEGAGSDGSLPESWSSFNDDKSVDAIKRFANNNVSRD